MSGSPHKPALTPADHEHFLEHGFVVVKNAVPPETIAAALNVLDSGTVRDDPGSAPYDPFRAEAVADCVTPTVWEAIAELFGPAYPFNRTRHATDMPRPYEPGTQWTTQGIHVDDDYPTVMPAGWALGMFIFLTPVRPHGGAFVYAPGSSYRYRSVVADNTEWLSFYAAQPDLAGPVQEFLAEPGDVLLFHHLLGHAGSKNVSDPATRHALLARWHPHRRIVPGAKPFEDMATIEKANSTRYLHHRYGAPHHLPDLAIDERTTRALREGFGVPGGIRAHGVLRYGGLTHLFFVAGAEPATIGHVHSRTWADWDAGESIQVPGAKVGALSFLRQGSDLLLFASVDDGGPRTHLLASRDLRQWSPMAALPDSLASAGHFTTDYGSKRAHGHVVFFVSPAEPAAVQARWGDEWRDVAAWTGRARFGAAPDGSSVLDAFVKPVLGEAEFGLIVDVGDPGASDASRPFYALSRDSARFEEPVQPITFSTPTPPRQMRVYARARRYWLVTYLRRVDGQDRIFWGRIDWDTTPIALEEIDSAQALEAALYVIGLT